MARTPERSAELTLRSVLLGTLLGVVFGASSLYLVLKVGLTVSASIPVAVLSIAIFRAAERVGARPATILEHNIVQTAGSAGESLAFGVGVTMPAILILGFDLTLLRVLSVTALGGLLGILMMIPLRRALMGGEAGAALPFPEGTACAAVLKAGTEHGADHGHAGKTVLGGFGLGLVYKVAVVALRGAKEVVGMRFGAPLAGGSIGAELSPELLGVGYVIGPRIAAVMCAGGVLAYLVLIPLIQFFGSGLDAPLAPGTLLIRDMAPGQIRQAYVLYIGAGAVTAGGIVSLVRALPVILRSVKKSLDDMRTERVALSADADRDLSPRFVGVMLVVLLAALSLTPELELGLAGALLVAVFGFLFVAVSARLTGEIGSSSNPVSGMTVATLLFTCLLFVLVGRTGPSAYVCALSVGAIVCIAAANGGGTAQDLKTGQLVGASPRAQQIAIMVGAFASALALGPVLLGLNQAGTVLVHVEKLGVYPAQVEATELAGEEVVDTAAGPERLAVYQKRDDAGGRHGKYLVDPRTHRPRYYVDPGINGAFNEREDGARVPKFEAPKATLMSYIIRGILDGVLPWGLVLFGVAIALVLELCQVPSLPFAVGLYLPLSSSTPIVVGGLVRWAVTRGSSGAAGAAHDEGESGPGVLFASGYIAGGAMAGIVFAALSAGFEQVDAALRSWAEAHNPMYEGPYADALSLLPFLLLAALLYRVARTASPNGRRVDGS